MATSNTQQNENNANMIVEPEGDHDCPRKEDEATKDVNQLSEVETRISEMTLKEETEDVSKFTTSDISKALLELEWRDNDETFHVFREIRRQMGREKVQKSPPRNTCGDSSLHVAVKQGDLRVVEYFLGMGENINCPGDRMRTPLHCAVAQGHLEIVRCLLKAGAEGVVKDADGFTPLGLAAGRPNKDCTKAILRHGIRPDEMEVFIAMESGHWKIVDWMLTRVGAFEFFWGRTRRRREKYPLIALACKANRWAIVDRLLDRGSTATFCTSDEECALVWAAQAGEADVVELLLSRGAANRPEQMRWALKATTSPAVIRAFLKEVPRFMISEYGQLENFEALILK